MGLDFNTAFGHGHHKTLIFNYTQPGVGGSFPFILTVLKQYKGLLLTANKIST